MKNLTCIYCQSSLIINSRVNDIPDAYFCGNCYLKYNVLVKYSYYIGDNHYSSVTLSLHNNGNYYQAHINPWQENIGIHLIDKISFNEISTKYKFYHNGQYFFK